MTWRLRSFLSCLLAALLLTSALGKQIGLQGARSGGADPFPNVTAPSGASSFTATWVTETGADGYLIYISTSAQSYPDQALYSYRYKAAGQATSSLVISGIASGTYYLRIAPYVGTTIGDVGPEYTGTAP